MAKYKKRRRSSGKGLIPGLSLNMSYLLLAGLGYYFYTRAGGSVLVTPGTTPTASAVTQSPVMVTSAQTAQVPIQNQPAVASVNV